VAWALLAANISTAFYFTFNVDFSTGLITSLAHGAEKLTME
jgi:hypothetical protein